MSDEYPKIIERPYKVFTGVPAYEYRLEVKSLVWTGVEWTYDKSFRKERDAAVYAERISEDYEFVKIEKKERNNG